MQVDALLVVMIIIRKAVTATRYLRDGKTSRFREPFVYKNMKSLNEMKKLPKSTKSNPFGEFFSNRD